MQPDSEPLGLQDRLTRRIEKNLLVVVGGMVIGAFAAGVGTLLFVQRIARSEVEDYWKGQLATLATAAVDARLKQTFGTREPALVKHFRSAANECVRINEFQYCWGRETRTPRWDAQVAASVVDHKFSFAAPFDNVPVVTPGIYSVGNQKIWAVYTSVRTASSFQVKAQDLSKAGHSDEHVLVSYVAVGVSTKE
jgi:hypothetical protein